MIKEIKQEEDASPHGILNHHNNQEEHKDKKHVHFRQEVQILEVDDPLLSKRLWNDSKNRKDKLDRGQFTEAEVKTLMNALCQYVVEADLDEDDLIGLCSKPKEELSEELRGAWCKIAESLPKRSVQSCHNFCRRKFNPNNYGGKWSKEEEEFLRQQVMENGHIWKEIAIAVNKKFASDDLEHRFGRTPENIKDKWKQMGGHHAGARNQGPWSIEEAIKLLKLIQLATFKKLMKKSVKVTIQFPEDNKKKPAKRMEIVQTSIDEDDEEEEEKESQIFIYDRSVQIEEVIPLIIKKNRCLKTVPTLEISWVAIHESMRTRSIDDIRNFWQHKLLPLLVPNINSKLNNISGKEWTEEDDLDLLVQILDQDVESQAEIDFADIDNERRPSDNQGRWLILLKGLGGVQPGMKYNVKLIAFKMIQDIKTKHERYVPWVDAKGNSNRTGKNQYINIVEYFQKYFQ